MEKNPRTASRCEGGEENVKSSSSSKTETVISLAYSALSPDNPNRRRYILQNFLLVWLDPNLDELNDDFRHSIAELQRIVNTIDTFADADQCVDYLTGIQDEKALMIVSGSRGQYLVPLIHDISQLNSIFVFCGNKLRHEQWTRDWPKVKGVFTEIGSICHALKQAACQCDQDLISISFVSTDETSSRNLNELDQSFMYTQILKEIFFEIEYDEQSIKDFVDYCREKFIDNDFELNIVAEFEREYHHKSPIWWYSYESFLYPMLNRALRTQEVDTLTKLGFFIQDLHRHIQELHSEQFGGQNVRTLTVYRGQGLSKENFDKLMKTKGGLMAFNNFLSTSLDRDVSLGFADSNRSDPNLIGILFQITIDPSISTTPFANIGMVSQFQSEQEILFSMHSIFRIGEIKKLDSSNQLWLVELKLTSDNDPLLSALTERMRKETREGARWHRLGILLIKLGHFDKAEQLYEVLLQQKTSDDTDKAFIYHMLGYSKNCQGDYIKAISFYEKSSEIYRKTLLPDHPALAVSYNNIGLVYDNIAEYSKALSFYEKALEIYQKALPSNHPDLATAYSNIGLVYSNMGDYPKAILFYEKALEIDHQTLPQNHPDLALSYSNIGLVYKNMGEYSKARSFYEKALEIREKTLPPDHPDLGQSYNNIGSLCYEMKEYSQALSFHEKALEIRQKTLPPNHPSLATSYSNIGSVYNSSNEYPKALLFYEKAFEIYQNSLPPSHPLLATSYNNIGSVYHNMGEYSKALSFYEKSLEIDQQTLPLNHPSLASSYNNIGFVYDKMGEYSKAFSFYEQALEIQQKTFAPNHPSIQTTKERLENVRKKL